MAISAKVQKDYLLTEARIALPADVAQVHEILRATKTSGKLVILYNDGFVQGINVEQRTKLNEAKSAEIRTLLAVEDKLL